MSADVIILPVVRIEHNLRGALDTARSKQTQVCLNCLCDAISEHHEELFAWLKAGGDERLLEFDPLKSWGPILKMAADLNRQLGKHSEHQS